MTTLVAAPLPPLPTITPYHADAMNDALCGASPNGIAGASAAYPADSVALFFPFRLEVEISVTQMFCSNGTATGDSVDLGLYTADGRRLGSTGLIAQTGTSVLQLISLTAVTLLGPGQFYLAISCNGHTSTFFRRASTAVFLQSMGAAQQDLSGAGTPGLLPATATFAAMAQAYLPIFGLIRTGFTI